MITATTPAVNARLLRGAVVVTVGLGVAQLSGYAINLVAARTLGPIGFSALASLLALIAIGNVLSLGLQAVVARRLVLSKPDHRNGVGRGALRAGAGAALALGIATAVVSPLVAPLLHFGGVAGVLMVAAALVPITALGGVQGVAQGRESHARLAAVYALTGAGKAVGAIVPAILTGDTDLTMLGFAIGSLAALAVAALVVRPLVTGTRLGLPRLTSETLHASHALLALFVLVSIDVLLARFFLPPETSGLYAAGAILTKVAFWLPQTAVVVAFPRLADRRRARTLGIGAAACAGLGAVVVLVAALAPDLVVAVIGGAAYEVLAPVVWLFALAGAVEAVAQYLLYSRLAVDDRRAVVAVWLAVLVLLLLVWRGPHDSITSVVVPVVLAASLLCLAGIVLSVRERRSGSPQPTPTSAAPGHGPGRNSG